MDIQEYIVPKHVVNDLAASFDIIKNSLSEVLDIPPATGNTSAATQWWRTVPPDDQAVVRGAFNAIMAPTLVSNIAIVRGDDKMVNTVLVQDSMNHEDPCYLVGEDEAGDNLRIRKLMTSEVMSSTLLLYLDAGVEPGLAEFNFTIEIDDFVTLLGVLDLYKRQYLISLLEHEPVTDQMKTSDVMKALEDGQEYADPRWLLPFVAPALPQIPPYDITRLNNSLYDLGKAGIINITDDYSTISFAEPTELLGIETLRKMTTIRMISLGYTPDGRPASQTSLFIRGESLIWFIDIGGETGHTATFAAIDIDKAGEIMNEIFTPVGLPESVHRTPTTQRETPMCPKCGKPATWIEQYKRWYCYSCQEYLEA